MKRMISSAVAAAAFASVPAQAQDKQAFPQIEHGRYLAVLGDCAGCHTAPGGKDLAGGLPIDTPFGKIVAPNITPDMATGIGAMSDDEFVAALQNGRGKGGRRLYPAMPYPYYTKMTRDEILAIRAYLSTVQPVNNPVVADQLPFPLNQRAVMIAWNELNFTPGRFTPDPKKSDMWNRGYYLVSGPGHCGACHTPKGILGGDKMKRAYEGTTLSGWFAPALTRDARYGLAAWSVADVARYLKTGANQWTLASGPMADVIRASTRHMTEGDLTAIATYLKDHGETKPAKEKPLSAKSAAMKAGAAIYKDNCAPCHRDDGMGSPELFPRLAGSAMVQSRDATTLSHVVLAGARAVATPGAVTAPAMPSFAWRLSDKEVADLLTYVRNQWGNAASAVSPSKIAEDRKGLMSSN